LIVESQGKIIGAEMNKRLIYLFVPLLVLSGLILSPRNVNAQGYESFRGQFTLLEESTRFQVGPFRIFPSLMLTNIGYDSNVYRQHEALEPVGDYTFTTALPIATHLLLREKWILSFTVTPEYIFYAQETRERSFNYSYSPSFKWQIFDRFVLSGSYFYGRSRRRATSEFDDRINERRRLAIGQFFYETGRRTSIGFTGRKLELRYDDADQPGSDVSYSEQLDRDESTAQGELYYQIWTDSQFFVNAGFTDVAFAHPETKWKDSYVYYIYPGIHFPLLGRLRGTLSVGYKIVDPYRAKKQGFEGFVGNTRLEYTWKRLVLRGSYARDLEFSYWTDNVFYIEDRYGLGVSFYMNQYLRLDYDFSYRDAFYPEPQTIRLPDETYVEINRSDQYTFHRAAILIRVFRRTAIGLQATYWERVSNIRREDRNQIIFGAFLTYEF